MEKKETRPPMIAIRGLKKEYRTGQINGTTLQEELKRRLSRRRGEEESRKDGRRYGERFLALDGVDLEIGAGEAVGIIGRNGAGKSTLLKLISRITAPTEGEIDLYGRVASMLEVGTGFNGEMTGRENIYLNGAILGMTRAEIDKKLEDIIEFSEVRPFIDTPVKRYSSGMYVKLAFSVAAHLDSEILIMDEVLAVGDMDFQKKCLDKMREASRQGGRTILYVSHNMNTIRRLCDRCVVLDEGKKVYDGDVDNAIAVYMGAKESDQATFVFDATFRPYDAALRINKRFEFQRLAILGEGGARLRAGQKREMAVACEALRPLRGVRFRLECWYQDGVKVGTMLSSSGLDLAPGAHELLLTMDLAHLMPGRYTADLVAYACDEDGSEDILDGVYPGVAFEVVGGLEETGGLDWHHQYWGHVRLHDLEVRAK